METRGFILQPTYRTEKGRPVVCLHGRLESGETFLVRDRRERPFFFIRASDAHWAGTAGAPPPLPTERHTLRGEPVVRIEVALPSDVPPLRERLRAKQVACFEADVRFATRYLIDRGIRGALAIVGEGHPGDGIGRIFDDPEVLPADWIPTLSILSFDIETDPAARRLLSIALYGAGASEVLLLSPRGDPVPRGAIGFPNERELLRAFCRRVREIDPDVLTGWNVIDFDLAVLDRLATRHGVPLELGRGPGVLRLNLDRSRYGTSRATVPGRPVLDGIAMLRGAFIRMEEYSLDFVARQVLGEGKLIAGSGRADEILHAYETDRARFVDYNLADARLVLEILGKLRIVPLAVERSRLTGMPIDRTSASIASFDFLYLGELGKRGIVAPTVAAEQEIEEPTSGGHVLDPVPGLHRNVLAFDFKSLYPSLIRTFQIDPLGLLTDPAADPDPIVAPNGAAFRRTGAILPRLLDDLVPRREEARRAGDATASQAIKILMNSFYGVLGTPACRFYDPALANAITGFGREILLWSKERFETWGHAVLYGDTDSLFVLSGAESTDAARALGAELRDRLNRELAEHVRRGWRVESRLELQLAAVYLRLVLLSQRHGGAGARKRYAGLVEEADATRVVFTGMEAVRRDWTPLARDLQGELYDRLFRDQPVEEYLRGVVQRLRGGELDSQLVYRKALRKDLAAYTATTPPHVAAARKSSRSGGRLIAYVMTANGPEPAAERASPIDHEHYVQKQIRPIAEPVLDLLGLSFDRVVGDDTQLDLFGG